MSSSMYAYMALENGTPVSGGPNLYHVFWYLKDVDDAERLMREGTISVWRAHGRKPYQAKNITDDVITKFNEWSK